MNAIYVAIYSLLSSLFSICINRPLNDDDDECLAGISRGLHKPLALLKRVPANRRVQAVEL